MLFEGLKKSKSIVVSKLHQDFMVRSFSASLGMMALASIYFVVLLKYQLAGHTWPLGAGIIAAAVIRLGLSFCAKKRWAYVASVNFALLQAGFWGVWVGQFLSWSEPNLPSMVSLLLVTGIGASLTTTFVTSVRLQALYLVLLMIPPAYMSWPQTHEAQPGFLSIPLIFLTYGIFLLAQGRRQLKIVKDRLYADQILVEEKALLRSVLDSIPGKVSLVSPSLKYVDVNFALLSFLGMKRDEIIGKHFGFFRQGDETASLLYKFMGSQEMTLQAEVELSTPVGEKRWHLVMINRTDFESCVVVVSIDIHAEKAAQLELTESRFRMEKASKLVALGEMAANIAHEIKNPLAVIHALAEVLGSEDEVTVLSSQDRMRYSKKIMETIMRISRTIDGIRSFIRLGRAADWQVFSLQKVVEEVLAVSDYELKLATIELRVGRVPEVNIHGSEIQVSQVLVNLLSNARYACEHSESSHRWISLDFEMTDLEEIEISVSDSGSGIPFEIQTKIMEPFFTTKPEGVGSGIGLSLSRSYAEAHGGSLRLDTKSSHTRFVFKLPVLLPGFAQTA
jgi:PAS domain S-box-containing protein